jgi:hypothetical protein
MKTDAERIELNELCSGLVDGSLTTTQHARLEELLGASEEARQFYVRAMHLSASLCQYAAEMQMPEPDNIIRPSQWQRWQRWFGPLAAAAIVLLGMWIGRVMLGGKPGGALPEEANSVARLSGAKDCVWVATALQPGEELARGQRLDLRSGFAEITFDSGAQLVLEGPATLDLRSEWEAELQRGTVKANVPQEAVGFRVTHATVEVVDLGTEFSVTAAEDGAAEVFVLKGAVEVHPRMTGGPRGKSVLREKQARRFAKAGPMEVRNSDEKFQRLMRKVMIDRIRNPINWTRWRFDEENGQLAKVENSGFSAGSIRVAGTGDHWMAGKWGGALSFNGQPAAKLSTPLKRGVRTVALWVRLPQAHSASTSTPIAGLPLGKGTIGSVELAVNSHPADGVPGALRLQSAGGWMIGSTPLLDGRWHHVAVVFSGNAKNRPAVAVYLDGRLESPSGKQGFQQRTDSAPSDGLWLGGEGFTGLIDELVLADRPLTPYEIRHLMRTNELVSPDSYAGS